MVIAFDTSEVRDYVLSCDKDEPKTIWKIGTIDTVLRAYINDKAFKYRKSSDVLDDSAEVSANVYMMYLEAIRFGLKGWENFKDKAGQEIPFSTVSIAIPGVGNREGLSDYILRKIHPDWVLELGKVILYENTLTPEVKKN